MNMYIGEGGNGRVPKFLKLWSLLNYTHSNILH
jgi:hypothetical protein